MKSIFVAFFAILLISPGCRITAPALPTEITVVIRVECRNERYITQSVLRLLRTENVRDITTSDNSPFIDIEATYVNISRLKFEKLERIEQQLKQTPGVMFVEIKNAISPVRATF